MNFLFVDTETTGLYPDKHAIIQLACIPKINGKLHPHFNEFAAPLATDVIDDNAFKSHGISAAKMKTFQPSAQMLDNFIKYLRSFNCKFIIAGYNVGFDKRFLSALFTKHKRADDFFDLFELQIHDTFLRVQKVKALLKTENMKLATLAKHFGVAINAHEALSDITATIAVDMKIGELLEEDPFVEELADNDITAESVISFPPVAQLHLHSMYGLTESVPSPEEWIEWCKKTKTPGLSIVDHGPATAMYFMTRVKEPEIVGVPGVCLYFFDGSEPDVVHPVNAWAVSNEGYFNLIKLASKGYDNQFEFDGVTYPKISIGQLKSKMRGIVFGGVDIYSPMGQAILAGDEKTAERYFDVYRSNLKDQFLVELNPISIRETYSAKSGFQKIKKNATVVEGDWGKAFNRFLVKLIDKHGLRCIPVSGAHFIDKSDKLIQDCISRNSFKSQKSYIESYHIKESGEIFSELHKQLGAWVTPEKFNTWISNANNVLAQAKNIKIEFKYLLPTIDIPQHIQDLSSNYDEQTRLLVEDFAKKNGRWSNDPTYVARFKKEMDVISRNPTLNFTPYFLMYADMCEYARSIGIMQNIGRGSAGGSLVSYYLHIIHIDPIATNLPFERFLSNERIRAGSFPDIDCDFGSRTEVLRYLQEKYKTGFAQICTIQKMKTKNAIKDAMWAMYGRNREDFEIRDLCELIPDSPQGVDEYDFLYGYTDKEGEYHRGTVETTPEVANFFKQYSQIEGMVKKLIGLPRSIGRHASAFVISSIDLSSERVPTMKIFDKHADGMIQVTQYDAGMVETSGLVKADILGVTTISMVSDALALIKQNTGIDYMESDEAGMPLIYRLPEDPGVYEDFYKKKTDSAFQFNSPVIKNVVKDFAPTDKEQLSVMTALMRPGAMDAMMDVGVSKNRDRAEKDGEHQAAVMSAADFYISVRKGENDPYYIHRDLEPILKETYGVMVFQEQVMSILVELCGYTLEESDKIRSAIAKKKHEVMMATFARIRQATEKRGWTTEQADSLCQQIQAFARYSFNRAHSRSYAELGYITMYLKRHHKLEWWAAVLNNTDSEDKLREFITLLGPIVEPPSLAVCTDKFEIFNGKLVAPISMVKRIGPSSVAELVHKGPFNSIEEYLEKVTPSRVNAGHFLALMHAGATNHLLDKKLPFLEARKKMWNQHLKARKSKKDTGQLDSLSALDSFLLEREYNKCFNKSLTEDPLIVADLRSIKPHLHATGVPGVPLMYGDELPIVSSAKSVLSMAAKKHDKEVGMFLLYVGSAHKKIVSKKTGKEYDLVEVELSDGTAPVMCSWWKKTKALGWPVNSIVFVRGKPNKTWKDQAGLEILEMEQIEDVSVRDTQKIASNFK